MMNVSGNNSDNSIKKKRGRVALRFAFATFVVAFVALIVLSLRLLSSTIKDESYTTAASNSGAVESSLRNFDVKVKNETFSQSLTDSSNQASTIIYKFIVRSKRVEVPDKDRKLAFLHIGKSGGSTISSLLRNGCISAVEGESCDENRWKKFPGKVGENETIASQRIQFYLHTHHVDSGKMAEYYSRISSLVVVARDPLDRWISAFLSRHPANMDTTRLRNRAAIIRASFKHVPPPIWAQKQVFGIDGVRNDQVHRVSYTGCYPNVQEFVDCATDMPIEKELYHTRITWLKGKNRHSEYITLNCRKICKEIANATSRHIHHIRLNYEAYLKDLPSDKEIFVIRTKHLWQDWRTVNNLLGSPTEVPIPESVDEGQVVNSQKNLPVKSNLSSNGQKILCRLLLNEYKLYIDLINRAVNLSDDDIKTTLEDVQRNCPAIFE